MSTIKPRHAIGYHFWTWHDIYDENLEAVRKTYDGPVDFAVDGMVWNITDDGIRTRVAMMNSQPFPPPSVTARQQAASGGEKYETPQWILQGYEWQTLQLMDQIHEEFNAEYGTEFKFPLRPETN